MNVARHLRLNYPNLKLLARARDRYHVHLLRDLGVEHIWRETYLSSLGMAYRALRELGISDEQAYNNIEIFRDYDEKLLIQQQSIYTDEQKVLKPIVMLWQNLNTYLKAMLNKPHRSTTLT